MVIKEKLAVANLCNATSAQKLPTTRKSTTSMIVRVNDSGQLSREVYNPDSQAGIAYPKMRVVYHRHTNDMLSRATVESLINVKQIKWILGSTKKINEAQPEAFYRRLQHCVDSEEKDTEKRDENGNKISNPKRDFELWPLIKVVRIYTYVKADAQSTGAVIVDLPGVHDSNAARAAVPHEAMHWNLDR